MQSARNAWKKGMATISMMVVPVLLSKFSGRGLMDWVTGNTEFIFCLIVVFFAFFLFFAVRGWKQPTGFILMLILIIL